MILGPKPTPHQIWISIGYPPANLPYPTLEKGTKIIDSKVPTGIGNMGQVIVLLLLQQHLAACVGLKGESHWCSGSWDVVICNPCLDLFLFGDVLWICTMGFITIKLPFGRICFITFSKHFKQIQGYRLETKISSVHQIHPIRFPIMGIKGAHPFPPQEISGLIQGQTDGLHPLNNLYLFCLRCFFFTFEPWYINHNFSPPFKGTYFLGSLFPFTSSRVTNPSYKWPQINGCLGFFIPINGVITL